MDRSSSDLQPQPDAAPAEPAGEAPTQPELTILALKPQTAPAAQAEPAAAMVEAVPAPEPAPAVELKLSSADRIAAAPEAPIASSIQPPVAPTALEEAHRFIDAMEQADARADAAPAAAAAAPSIMARIRAMALWTRERRRHAAYAGGAAAALAAGWVGAAVLTAPAPPAKSDPLAAQTAMRVEQLSADIRGVRDAVAALAKTGARSRGGDDLKPLQERVGALNDAVDKLRADQSQKIAGLVGSADRGEKADRDMSAKMAQIVERLDRIERGAAPQTTGSIPQQPQAQPAPAAQPIPAPPPRPVAEKPAAPKPLAGWALRDIYDGLALIESRQAGLIEVAPGQIVRGLGRIEKIEQRGGRWVVVTQQGVIAAN